MKVIYVPLDERPCNLQYPIDIAKTNDEIEIVRPKLEQLGNKKKAANIVGINQFLKQECEDNVIIICSIDMLVYGGLIPSRLHQEEQIILEKRLEILEQLKADYTNIKIYAFTSIMRTPSYSSSDEEPDYYEEYGTQIFTSKYLCDQIEREGGNPELEKKLKKINIPSEVINDYELRRQKNLKVTEKVLDLLENKIINHLVIFQDDSAPYGYTAIDQKIVKNKISDANLINKVDIYPGADEVGCSLLARSYLDEKGMKKTIYAEYSSIKGPSIIPLYEDRPMFETLKAHVEVTNGILIDSTNAELILMINAPGEKMQESWDQFQNRDRTYDSYRNLKHFVTKIQYYVNLGKKVAVADCAYANGCDLELIKLLDEKELLDQIYAYAGWNTHANTLGTVISAANIAKECNLVVINNIINQIIEGGLYQSKIRMDINQNYLNKFDLNYFDLKNKQNVIVEMETEKIKKALTNYRFTKKYQIDNLEIKHPWNRMFEIEVKSKISYKKK